MKTTYREDTHVVTDALKRCLDAKDGLPFIGLIFHMKDSAHHVGVPREDSEGLSIEERIKFGKYGQYIEMVATFMVSFKLCYLQARAVDQGPLPPIELYLLLPTRFGRLFVKLPFGIRFLYVAASLFLVGAVEFIKKYRWVVSLGSVAAAIVRILQGHELTVAFLLIAGAAGVVVALIIAWVSSIFSGRLSG